MSTRISNALVLLPKLWYLLPAAGYGLMREVIHTAALATSLLLGTCNAAGKYQCEPSSMAFLLADGRSYATVAAFAVQPVCRIPPPTTMLTTALARKPLQILDAVSHHFKARGAEYLDL